MKSKIDAFQIGAFMSFFAGCLCLVLYFAGNTAVNLSMSVLYFVISFLSWVISELHDDLAKLYEKIIELEEKK